MFFSVLTQVIILLILIMLGFILTKGNILTDKGVKSMTDMVLLLVTPCVIIKSFIRKFDKSLLKSLLISFLIAFLVHIGFILFSRLLKDSDMSKQRVLQFGVIFSNCGYMSIPLQQALLGEEGVFYGYGIILMSGDKKHLSPKKLVINPGMIGLSVGLIIFLFSIPIPKIFSEPISYIASLNTPLPMIIIGYHLAHSNLLNGIKSIKCIITVTMKLVLLPLTALGIMYACGIRGTMLVSSVISCSAPTAAITTMFSSKFERDTDLSVNLVSLSTVLSLVTMPILITIAKYLA